MTNKTNKPILVFILLTFGLSAFFYVPIARLGSLDSSALGSLLVLGLMWCPGIAALITRRVLKIQEPGLGWRLGSPRYLLLGFVIPILYSLVTYGVIWVSGAAPFQNNLSPVRLAIMIVITCIIGNLSSLGEEIGWRGFLVPQLWQRFGFAPAALISGAIWAAWHLPVLLTTDYNRGSLGLFSLVMFFLLAVSVSFTFAWLRLKSNSLWPAVLLHTSHNVFVLNVFDSMTAQTPLAPYLISETGAGLVIANLILAFLFWRLENRLPASHLTPQPTQAD